MPRASRIVLQVEWRSRVRPNTLKTSSGLIRMREMTNGRYAYFAFVARDVLRARDCRTRRSRPPSAALPRSFRIIRASNRRNVAVNRKTVTQLATSKYFGRDETAEKTADRPVSKSSHTRVINRSLTMIRYLLHHRDFTRYLARSRCIVAANNK